MKEGCLYTSIIPSSFPYPMTKSLEPIQSENVPNLTQYIKDQQISKSTYLNDTSSHSSETQCYTICQPHPSVGTTSLEKWYQIRPGQRYCSWNHCTRVCSNDCRIKEGEITLNWRFTLVHNPGKWRQGSDALSRNPSPKDANGWNNTISQPFQPPFTIQQHHHFGPVLGNIPSTHWYH